MYGLEQFSTCKTTFPLKWLNDFKRNVKFIIIERIKKYMKIKLVIEKPEYNVWRVSKCVYHFGFYIKLWLTQIFILTNKLGQPLLLSSRMKNSLTRDLNHIYIYIYIRSAEKNLNEERGFILEIDMPYYQYAFRRFSCSLSTPLKTLFKNFQKKSFSKDFFSWK